MSRNGSGTYAKVNTFVAGQTITAASHNSNWDDIASEMTNSVAADGQTTMTGPLKHSSGTNAAPSITFASDTDTGIYRSTANEVSIAASANQIASFGTAGAVFYAPIVASATATFGSLIATATATFSQGVIVSATSTFTDAVGFTTTGAITLPNGTTAQRPSAVSGMVRFNTSTNALEFYDGSAWQSASISNAPSAIYKNLSIKVATNTTVTVAADFVVVTDGTKFQTLAFSSTVNLGTTGADALDTGTIAIDTWYAIWAIAKADGTAKCLASTSDTSPTMPSGYTYKARIGWVQTIHASATLYGTWQLGRRAQYVQGLAQTSSLGAIASGTNSSTYSTTAPTWSTPSVARFVPTTASEIIVLCVGGKNGGTAAKVIVAPSDSYTGYAGATPPPVSVDATVLNAHTVCTSFILEGTTIAYASSAAGGAVQCLGWIDNI